MHLPHQGSTTVATLNGVSLGSFKPTGRIIICGGDGNATITIDPTISLTAQLCGEAGNDILTGSSGNDILIADSTSHDTNSAALASILAEWTRPKVSLPCAPRT